MYRPLLTPATIQVEKKDCETGMDSSIADGEWRGEKEGGSVEVRAEETFHFREHLQTILFAAKGFIGQRQFHISRARDICCP